MNDHWRIEQSSLGRVLLPPDLDLPFFLFYTTVDFSGMLDPPACHALVAFMGQRFNTEASLVSCHQVHGVEAHRVSGMERPAEPSRCDALFTAESEVALGIKVADCLPVTLVDPDLHLIANIHSGWRGAAGEIVSRTLDAAFEDCEPADTFAFLGPSIRSCCLEVGEEVVDAFRVRHPHIDRYLDRGRGARPYLDIPSLTRDVLSDRGTSSSRIFDSELCTRCAGSIFHSYRRDGPRSGRNLAVAALKSQ